MKKITIAIMLLLTCTSCTSSFGKVNVLSKTDADTDVFTFKGSKVSTLCVDGFKYVLIKSGRGLDFEQFLNKDGLPIQCNMINNGSAPADQEAK